MTREGPPRRPPLPIPTKTAYFPTEGGINVDLQREVLYRAGTKNLVCALEYGSHVTGDAGKNSMHDIIIIVDDVKQFHIDGLRLHGADYAQPHLAQWHAFLNHYGLNYYHTEIRGQDDQIFSAKLVVISKDDFIRGCSGTLVEGEKDPNRRGTFGMYVAGRLQKAAFFPYHNKGEKEKALIEAAINTARIDGVWYALGFLKDRFTYSELLKTYVSLSYWADVRVEKSGKIETLIKNNQLDYYDMLQPILQSFIDQEIITVVKEGFGWYKKAYSLSTAETYARLLKLKTISFLINYVKNLFTATPQKALTYAVLKLVRTIDSWDVVKEAKRKARNS